jgi:hypothetical protein
MSTNFLKSIMNVNKSIRVAKSMNKKDEVSISIMTRCLILFNLLLIVAQDLNPPTTGKTSPHVTSTFGPNIPGPATSSSSSTTDNGSQGSMTIGNMDHANAP